MRVLRFHPNRARLHLSATALLLVYLLLRPAASLGAQDGDMQAFQRIGKECARIAEQAYPAVATITVRRSEASEEVLEQFGLPRGRPLSRGLGIVVSADGWIVTTSRVVGDANNVEVRLTDGRSFQGKVTGTDPATAIAVVKIEAENIKALELGDSDAVALGDWVISISDPAGLGRSFTVGLVTGKHRSDLAMADYEDFIQTDTVPTPGDGGGPALDLHGRVVGMNAAVLGSRWGGGIGLAIPINMVKAVYDPLSSGNPVRRGYLGIQMQDVDADMAARLGLGKAAGVLVASVVEASPAAEAGLQKGDVIVQLDNEEISSSHQFRLAVARRSPDTDVDLVVLRDGQRQHFTVTLTERPSEP